MKDTEVANVFDGGRYHEGLKDKSEKSKRWFNRKSSGRIEKLKRFCVEEGEWIIHDKVLIPIECRLEIIVNGKVERKDQLFKGKSPMKRRGDG